MRVVRRRGDASASSKSNRSGRRNSFRIHFQLEKFRVGIDLRTKFDKIGAINEANELVGVEPLKDTRIEVFHFFEMEGMSRVIIEVGVAIGYGSCDLLSHP